MQLFHLKADRQKGKGESLAKFSFSDKKKMLKPQFKGYARDEYVEPKEEL